MLDKTGSPTYIDEERLTALSLSVKFWGQVSTNPKTTPVTEQRVLQTADRFYHWLINP
jgi:hypothetical protein